MKFTPAFSTAIAVLGWTTTAWLGSIAPASAQSCTALEVVGGEGTEVTKTVSLPGVLFVDSNWNTDFAVPSGTSYRFFEVTFVPESGESYDIDVNLKYSDDSTDAAYSVRDGDFPEGRAVSIRAEARNNSSPFQVNLRVGGINAGGNTYRASVRGCR